MRGRCPTLDPVPYTHNAVGGVHILEGKGHFLRTHDGNTVRSHIQMEKPSIAAHGNHQLILTGTHWDTSVAQLVTLPPHLPVLLLP